MNKSEKGVIMNNNEFFYKNNYDYKRNEIYGNPNYFNNYTYHPYYSNTGNDFNGLQQGIYDTNQANLYYRQQKPLTFVLVHGSWADSSFWNGIANQLRELGHIVYTPIVDIEIIPFLCQLWS